MKQAIKLVHKLLKRLNENRLFHLSIGIGIIIYICWDSEISYAHHGAVAYIVLTQLQNILAVVEQFIEGL